jgi:hypothetical protein
MYIYIPHIMDIMNPIPEPIPPKPLYP